MSGSCVDKSIDLLFLALRLQQLRISKDLHFPLRQQHACHISKVALRSTPIMHVFMKLIEMMLNKISQSIELDCERLQCLMSIYNRQNMSALAD